MQSNKLIPRNNISVKVRIVFGLTLTLRSKRTLDLKHCALNSDDVFLKLNTWSKPCLKTQTQSNLF